MGHAPRAVDEVHVLAVHGTHSFVLEGTSGEPPPGGIVGAVAVEAIEAQQWGPGASARPGARMLQLTDRRCLVYDAGRLTGACALADVTGVHLKRAFSNPLRLVLTIQTGGRRQVRIEGDRGDLEHAALEVARLAHLGGRGVRREGVLFLPKACAVAVLALVAGALLVTAPSRFAGEGTVAGLELSLLGLCSIAAAVVLDRVWFRR